MSPREVVRYANMCRNWRKFRDDLKGKSTAHKLEKLKEYLVTYNRCCYGDRRKLQVYNYLQKLVALGYLEKFESPTALEDGEVLVKS